jgi:hypothetical protein
MRLALGGQATARGSAAAPSANAAVNASSPSAARMRALIRSTSPRSAGGSGASVPLRVASAVPSSRAAWLCSPRSDSAPAIPSRANELHATSVRTGVSFVGGSACFDADGRPLEPERSERAAKSMLDEIAWWADALRRQRARRPYQPGAGE